MSPARFIATSDGFLRGPGVAFRCALGKGGIMPACDKREGDGASPAGIWQMKRLFYRPDRIDKPRSGLPCIALKPHDAWCDAPQHPLYNRPVTRPFAASHERLWRDDHIYDVIVELSHNDNPVVPDLGSAIFFHLAHDDYRPTQGCVAISQPDMADLLGLASIGTELEIAL